VAVSHNSPGGIKLKKITSVRKTSTFELVLIPGCNLITARYLPPMFNPHSHIESFSKMSLHICLFEAYE
jgi:hypothetical protein